MDLRAGTASGPCIRNGLPQRPALSSLVDSPLEVRCMAGRHEPHAQGWKAHMAAANGAAASLCH